MRIGFDVSQTGALRAGCGQAAHCLLEGLLELAPEHHYLLYPDFGHYRERNPFALPRRKAKNLRCGPRPLGFGAGRAFWDNPGPDFEARLGYPDVVQANNFYCPQGLKKARLIYYLHDLSFVHDPDYTSEANRLDCFNGVFEASLRADLVVANSDFTRRHFLDVFPHYPAGRTRVAHLASRFTEDQPEPAPWPGLTPGRFWLTVGTIEPRKNQLRLFEALSRLGEPDFPLVLAGGQGWLMDDVKQRLAELGLSKRVILTGYLKDEPLRWLYRNCYAFVYPSLFEGFGLPLLEAMSQGSAVITSNLSALPEVAGQAALLVDPFNVEDIAQAMNRLFREPGLREALREKGFLRSREFRWRNSAAKLLEYYAQALSEPKFVAPSQAKELG